MPLFDQPWVDLVLITHGNAPMVERNLRDLLENTDYPNYRLFIVDNQSLDDTWQRVCDVLYQYEQAFGVQVHVNMGYGQACNLGSKLGGSPYLIFLNSDVHTVESCRDWITPLLETFHDHQDVAVCSPKLVNDDGLLMGCGVVGTNKERRIRGWLEPDKGEYETPDEVLSVCGAVYAVPREIFHEYQGFDALFRHYHNETDFDFKVRSDGLKVVYQPRSVMVHQHMGSCRDQNLLGRMAEESEMIFQQKWAGFLEDPTTYPIPLEAPK